MARIKFTGPEGAAWVDKDLVMVRPGKAKIRDLAELQRGTGLKMADLQGQMGGNEALALQAVLFLTLRNAGFMVRFDDAGEIAEDEFEAIVEPGDLPEEVVPDPQSTPAFEAASDHGTPAAVSPSKPKKSGSKPRS